MRCTSSKSCASSKDRASCSHVALEMRKSSIVSSAARSSARSSGVHTSLVRTLRDGVELLGAEPFSAAHPHVLVPLVGRRGLPRHAADDELSEPWLDHRVRGGQHVAEGEPLVRQGDVEGVETQDRRHGQRIGTAGEVDLRTTQIAQQDLFGLGRPRLDGHGSEALVTPVAHEPATAGSRKRHDDRVAGRCCLAQLGRRLVAL